LNRNPLGVSRRHPQGATLNERPARGSRRVCALRGERLPLLPRLPRALAALIEYFGQIYGTVPLLVPFHRLAHLFGRLALGAGSAESGWRCYLGAALSEPPLQRFTPTSAPCIERPPHSPGLPARAGDRRSGKWPFVSAI
jgi:hypothetical protein